MFYNDGNIFLRTSFKHFDFIEWFGLNFNANSLLEILSINDFLVDYSVNVLFDSLMWLFISPNLAYSS